VPSSRRPRLDGGERPVPAEDGQGIVGEIDYEAGACSGDTPVTPAAEPGRPAPAVTACRPDPARSA
jgi:hypothetical protein